MICDSIVDYREAMMDAEADYVDSLMVENFTEAEIAAMTPDELHDAKQWVLDC